MRIAFSAGIADVRQARPRRALATLDPAVAAWLAAVPVALVTLLAIVLLGPPLGATLLPQPSAHFFPSVLDGVHPEPTEQARYLIALTAPLLLAALTLRLVRHPPERLSERSAAQLARGVEWLAVAVLVGCFALQRILPPQGRRGAPPIVYFTWPSVIAAIAIAAAIALLVRSAAARSAWSRWSAESPARQVGAALVALLALGITLLPALNTDGSLAHEVEGVIYHLQFTYDESVSVLAGRSPLGDFATQYSALWPYALAGGMSILGPSVGAFTGLVTALIGVMLLALYDILRRVARSSLVALLLFLPLLATCAFKLHGPSVNRFSLVTYYGVLPLRYAGPFLLAWLLARHLDGARTRRLWPLFLWGGVVVLNNTDFGLAALGATVAALLWTQTARPDATAARRAALEAFAGLAGALALVTVLLLARTGEPPHLGLLTRYAHLFVVDGFAMLPMRPVVGFVTIIYLTHVAAIGVATVRALRREPDRLMTGLLAWSGIFGLGAGSYYVGHSLSEVLIYTFPVWGLTVTLLTLLTLRGAAPGAWLSPARLAVLVGFGLLCCSLAQTSPPWLQLQRLSRDGPHVFAQPIGQQFVAANAQPGETVLIMSGLGHRIAINLGLHDLERFTGARSIFTADQLRESLAQLRAAGGTKVFVLLLEAFPGLAEALERDYERRAQSPEGMALWVAR
jgi:hypothetical protein